MADERSFRADKSEPRADESQSPAADDAAGDGSDDYDAVVDGSNDGDGDTDGTDGPVSDDTSGDRGTYTLVVDLPVAATIEVGALGAVDFPSGWYAYTGSAFGPGGFRRVERHRELATGERDIRHWHVDYLLGHPEATVDSVVRTPGIDAECAVSGRLDGDRVTDFGASDCDCGSHLAYSPTRDRLLAAVERAHDRGTAAGDDVSDR